MLGQVVVEDPKGFVEIIISGQRRIDQGVVDAFGGVSVFLGGMGILCFMLGFLYLRTQQILLDKRALERRLEEYCPKYRETIRALNLCHTSSTNLLSPDGQYLIEYFDERPHEINVRMKYTKTGKSLWRRAPLNTTPGRLLETSMVAEERTHDSGGDRDARRFRSGARVVGRAGARPYRRRSLNAKR